MRLSYKCIILFAIPLFLFFAGIYLSNYVLEGKYICDTRLVGDRYCASSHQIFYSNLFGGIAFVFFAFFVFVPIGIYIFRTMSKMSFAFFLFPVFVFFSSICIAAIVMGNKIDCSGLCEVRGNCATLFQLQISESAGMIALVSMLATYILPLVVNIQTRDEKSNLFP
jgi:hypothetical protein